MKEREGIVQKVVSSSGKHGPYAVATVDGIEGSVTFSLSTKVWQEQDYPEQGNTVLLTDIRRKRAGWRAMKGRFMRPEE